uniref:Secreted protein n=1 Tax=Schistosoma mansoni TaxID=6183 RepID=A0A5K4F6E0_SCHMA
MNTVLFLSVVSCLICSMVIPNVEGYGYWFGVDHDEQTVAPMQVVRFSPNNLICICNTSEVDQVQTLPPPLSICPFCVNIRRIQS